MPSQTVSAHTQRPSSGSIGNSSLSASLEKKQNGHPTASSTSTTSVPHVPGKSSPAPKSHPRTHAVGHGRPYHGRTPSYGKSVNRLAKAHQGSAGETAATTRVHRHSHSHSHTPPSSPRLKATTAKRTGSALSLARNGSTVSLKKNTSTVSLNRNLSRLSVKAVEPKAAAKKALKSESRAHAPDQNSQKKGKKHPAVHFDLDNEGPDADWTEISNSESPSKSRPGEARGATPESLSDGQQDHATGSGLPVDQLRRQTARSPPLPETRSSRARDRLSPTRLRTVSAPMHPSPSQGRPQPISTPQATITSRLLGRHPPHNAPPQMSAVSATFAPALNSPRGSTRSQSSTAPGTPGRDNVVSRFIIGSHEGTPGAGDDDAGSMSPLRRPYSGMERRSTGIAAGSCERDRDDDDGDQVRRRRSTGNLLLPARGSPDSDGSGGSLRPQNLPPQPSRIQQKLWLQRASSNVEPQQLMPGEGGIGIGGSAAGGTGALVGAGFGGAGRDPRVQKQFDRAEVEYNVLRRFQNPLLDSIARLSRMRGVELGGRSASSGPSSGVGSNPGTPRAVTFMFDGRGGEHQHPGSAGNAQYASPNDGRPSRRGGGGSIRSARSVRRGSGGSGVGANQHSTPDSRPSQSSHHPRSARFRTQSTDCPPSEGVSPRPQSYYGHGGDVDPRDFDEKENYHHRRPERSHIRLSRDKDGTRAVDGDGASDAGDCLQHQDADEGSVGPPSRDMMGVGGEADEEEQQGEDDKAQDDGELDRIEQIKRRMWERMDDAGAGD